MSAQTAVPSAFAALADPSRRAVLTVLGRQGTGTASDIARLLPITRQAVMKHLAVLEDAGLVRREPDGRGVRYVLVAEPLTTAAGWLRALAVSWDDRLAAIRSAAEQPERD